MTTSLSYSLSVGTSVPITCNLPVPPTTSLVISTATPLPSVGPSLSATDSTDSFLLGLEVWEVGLVGANALAVLLLLLLLLCAVTVILCVCQRKPQRHNNHEAIPLKELVEMEESAEHSSQIINNFL